MIDSVVCPGCSQEIDVTIDRDDNGVSIGGRYTLGSHDDVRMSMGRKTGGGVAKVSIRIPCGFSSGIVEVLT